MTTALTRKLGEFVAGLRYEQIPAAATSVIRTGFTDCVGVMIAGSREPVVQLLAELQDDFVRRPEIQALMPLDQLPRVSRFPGLGAA